MREKPNERQLRHASPAGRKVAHQTMVHYHAVTLRLVKRARSQRQKRVLARERRRMRRQVTALTQVRMTQLLDTYAAP